MSTITRLHPAKRYSEASVHNGAVYLTGQVADGATQDIGGQTAQVLAAISGGSGWTGAAIGAVTGGVVGNIKGSKQP